MPSCVRKGSRRRWVWVCWSGIGLACSAWPRTRRSAARVRRPPCCIRWPAGENGRARAACICRSGGTTGRLWPCTPRPVSRRCTSTITVNARRARAGQPLVQANRPRPKRPNRTEDTMSLLFPNFVTGRGALGLFLVRVVTGAAFVFHGWYKVDSPGGLLGWMGPDAQVPGVVQGLAVLAEIGGGAALALGLMTPLASLAIAGVMVAALAMVHVPAGHPFVGRPQQHSFELAAVYLANAILF